MLPPTRILIVEDEGLLAENLKLFLARRSPDVRIATDAYSTLKILESFTPDVVVLDFGLPGMDGLQIYAVVVRHQAPHACCIMISGHLTEHISHMVNDYGIHHVLCKPFSFAALQDMIDQSLAEATANHAADALIATQHPRQAASPPLPVHQDRRLANNRRRLEQRMLPDRRHLNVTSEQGA